MEKELNLLNEDTAEEKSEIPKLKTEKIIEAIILSRLTFKGNNYRQQPKYLKNITYVFEFSSFLFKPPTKFIV